MRFLNNIAIVGHHAAAFRVVFVGIAKKGLVGREEALVGSLSTDGMRRPALACRHGWGWRSPSPSFRTLWCAQGHYLLFVTIEKEQKVAVN